MKKNPIQFAVVREDSQIEESLIREQNIQKVLMICSGGCTALHLLSKFPQISLTLLDPNESQINLVQQKIALLCSNQNREQIFNQFNVENSDSNGLNQCGNFESLFRNLRFFINEMIADNASWEGFFQGNALTGFLEQVFQNPYWKAAFEIFFSDIHLTTMFGPEAVQHAMPKSYPIYFRKLFERGLSEKNSTDNYFLHHVFLGKYLKHSTPAYLKHSFKQPSIKYIHGFFKDVSSLKLYQMINLSNILDWMSQEEAQKLMLRIKQEAPLGCLILWRQLNNETDYKKHLAPEFEFSSVREQQALRSDTSLFYSKICIGQKVNEKK